MIYHAMNWLDFIASQLCIVSSLNMYLKLAKARKYIATDSFVLVSNAKLRVIETDSFLFCYVLYLINILLRFFFVIEKRKKKNRKNLFTSCALSFDHFVPVQFWLSLC